MEKMTWSRNLLLSLFVLGQTIGHPRVDNYQYYNDAAYDYNDNYSDNYNDDIGQEEVEVIDKVHKPKIIMNPKTIVVDQNKTIRIPCTVDKLPVEMVQLLWSRVDDMNTIIAMGKDIIRGQYTERASVIVDEHGSTLLIKEAREEDSGQYKCKVATGEKDQPEIVHTVSVIPAPEIIALDVGESEVVTARPGDDVTLTCSAEGKPQPSLSWSRPGAMMKNGGKIIDGGVINLVAVDVQDSGAYICSADNGYNEPVSKKIIVKIEDVSKEVEEEHDTQYVNDESDDSEDKIKGEEAKPMVDKMISLPSSSSQIFNSFLYVCAFFVFVLIC